MPSLKMQRRGLFAALGAMVAAPRLARAAWPERPLQLIVPFAAGGGTDISARTMAQFLERELGQPVVVQNRPGAGGEIGLSAIADARPDGYTIGIINTPGIVTIPIERTPRWSLASFTFIAGVVEDPTTFAVHPESPIRGITDLVAAAKAKPGEVTVGTQGVGSAGHISTLLLEQAAGIRFECVSYAGSAPAAVALLRRDIQVTTASLGESLTFAQQQPWRVLGLMSSARSELGRPMCLPLRKQVTIFAAGRFVALAHRAVSRMMWCVALLARLAMCCATRNFVRPVRAHSSRYAFWIVGIIWPICRMQMPRIVRFGVCGLGIADAAAD